MCCTLQIHLLSKPHILHLKFFTNTSTVAPILLPFGFSQRTGIDPFLIKGIEFLIIQLCRQGFHILLTKQMMAGVYHCEFAKAAHRLAKGSGMSL
jgi:hypothetical protein